MRIVLIAIFMVVGNAIAEEGELNKSEESACPFHMTYCPQGRYGAGGCYNPAMARCNDGVVVSHGMLFCPPGANGNGGIYNPAYVTCQNGKLSSITSP